VTLLDDFTALIRGLDVPSAELAYADQAVAYLRELLAEEGLDLDDPRVYRTALVMAQLAGLWAFDGDDGAAVQTLAAILAYLDQGVGR
jgi:hypothetical protein